MKWTKKKCVDLMDHLVVYFTNSLTREKVGMKYNFIGWCKEGNHDKIWACIEVVEATVNSEAVYVTVWGRRGKALQHKIVSEKYPSMYENGFNKRGWSYSGIDKKISSKVAKGYNPVSVEFLDEVYPEFQEDLKMLAVWATLGA